MIASQLLGAILVFVGLVVGFMGPTIVQQTFGLMAFLGGCVIAQLGLLYSLQAQLRELNRQAYIVSKLLESIHHNSAASVYYQSSGQEQVMDLHIDEIRKEAYKHAAKI